jgi:hypothetical protein
MEKNLSRIRILDPGDKKSPESRIRIRNADFKINIFLHINNNECEGVLLRSFVGSEFERQKPDPVPNIFKNFFSQKFTHKWAKIVFGKIRYPNFASIRFTKSTQK